MLKTTLIILLGGALLVAAVVTRPNETSARAFLVGDAKVAAQGPKTVGEALKDAVMKSAETGQPGVPAGYTFKDRVLWVEVQKDGQPAYTGVLAHWFKNDEPAPAPPAAPGTQPSKPADAPLAVAPGRR